MNMRQEPYRTSKRKPIGTEHARKKQVVIHQEGGYDSRYKRRRKPAKGRKIQRVRYLFLVILIVLAVISASSFIWAYTMAGKKQEDSGVRMRDVSNPYIASQTREIMKENWTIAVFGVDSMDGSLEKGTNADVIMLCNVNQKTGGIRMVSVYRDTCMKIGEKNPYKKINEAYARGGIRQAAEALNENLDIEIDDYAAVNWKAAADTVNLLGGIEADISQAEFEYINSYITSTVEGSGVGSYQLKTPGPNHLDGVQSVAYARLRKMDTDFQRTKRQREVLQKVLEKAKKADISTLVSLLNGVLPQIVTSLGIDDLIPIAANLKKYHLEAADGFPFELETRRIDENGVKIDYVFPMDLERNVIQLHGFLYNTEEYEVSKQVKEISQAVEQKRRQEGNSAKKMETSVSPSRSAVPVTEGFDPTAEELFQKPADKY